MSSEKEGINKNKVYYTFQHNSVTMGSDDQMFIHIYDSYSSVLFESVDIPCIFYNIVINF